MSPHFKICSFLRLSQFLFGQFTSIFLTCATLFLFMVLNPSIGALLPCAPSRTLLFFPFQAAVSPTCHSWADRSQTSLGFRVPPRQPSSGHPRPAVPAGCEAPPRPRTPRDPRDTGRALGSSPKSRASP